MIEDYARMKRTVLLLFAFCVLISLVVMAREYVPLKWSAQRWEFVVIVETGDWVIRQDTASSKYVEMKVVSILRGEKKNVGEIEWWRGKELQPKRRYLFCYHLSPPGSSGWDHYEMAETKNGWMVLSIDAGDQPWTRMGADAISVTDLEKYLKEIPFEANPTNTLFYQNGMVR